VASETRTDEAGFWEAVRVLADGACGLAQHAIPERLEDAPMCVDELREAAERVRDFAGRRAAVCRVPEVRSLRAALALEALGTVAWWLFVQPGSRSGDVEKWADVLVRRVEDLGSVLGLEPVGERNGHHDTA